MKLNQDVRVGILVGICIIGNTSPVSEEIFKALQRVWAISPNDYLGLTDEIAAEIGLDLTVH